MPDTEDVVDVVEFGGRQISFPFKDLIPQQSADKLAELEASIRAHGILVDLLVNQDDVMIEGHSRFAMAVKIGLEPDKVPFKVINADWAKSEELAIALNFVRRQLQPDERAALVKKLKSKGWTVTRISKALGIGRATIQYDIHGRPPEAKPDGKPTADTKAADESDDVVTPLDELSGDIDSDWGLSNNDGGTTVPGDDLEAAARSGITAVGQLIRALQRTAEYGGRVTCSCGHIRSTRSSALRS
jgi:ParB-like chromosome segregation protein Spo0J